MERESLELDLKNGIEQGNKLIAEFMELENAFSHVVDKYGVHTVDGYKTPFISSYGHPDDDNSSIYPADKLRYHSSWDWLMPVVEKIETLKDINGERFHVTVEDNYCRIDTGLCYAFNIAHLSRNKHSATWDAVVDFIKFYKKEISDHDNRKY